MSNSQSLSLSFLKDGEVLGLSVSYFGALLILVLAIFCLFNFSVASAASSVEKVTSSVNCFQGSFVGTAARLSYKLNDQLKCSAV